MELGIQSHEFSTFAGQKLPAYEHQVQAVVTDAKALANSISELKSQYLLMVTKLTEMQSRIEELSSDKIDKDEAEKHIGQLSVEVEKIVQSQKTANSTIRHLKTSITKLTPQSSQRASIAPGYTTPFIPYTTPPSNISYVHTPVGAYVTPPPFKRPWVETLSTGSSGTDSPISTWDLIIIENHLERMETIYDSFPLTMEEIVDVAQQQGIDMREGWQVLQRRSSKLHRIKASKDISEKNQHIILMRKDM